MTLRRANSSTTQPSNSSGIRAPSSGVVGVAVDHIACRPAVGSKVAEEDSPVEDSPAQEAESHSSCARRQFAKLLCQCLDN
jgi:hypothetical protein